MIAGYARVSTEEQKLDLQIQALESAGCEHIYTDHGQSGASFNRTGLESVLKDLKEGDRLVVWRLDRLGRSLSGLISFMDDLGRRKVHFCSITENIDTASSGGRLMFHMMAALAEFERAVISERTRAGLAAAKALGKSLGRPQSLTTEQVRRAFCAITCNGVGPGEAAVDLGVSPRTLRRYLRALTENGRAMFRPCRNCPSAQARQPFFREREQRAG